MAFFIATIKEGNNRKTIEVEADSLEDAEFVALGKADTVISIVKKSDFSFFDTGMTFEERTTFLNTLATLCAALPIHEALQLMMNNFNGRIKKVCSLLKQKVESGTEPDLAIEQIGSPDFPSTTVAMIRAGMSAGDMGGSLRESAEFEMEMGRLEKDSKKGIGLQMAGFVFAAITILASKYLFVPYIFKEYMADILKNVDIGWVDTFTNVVTYSMILLILIFSFLTLLSTVGRKIDPSNADKLISKIPIYKDLILAKSNFITIYQLSKLMEKGVPLRTCLIRTTENMKKSKLKEDFTQAIINLGDGVNWVDALETFNPMDKAALSAATDSKKSARILKELSIQYKYKYKSVIEKISGLLYFLVMFYLILATIILFAYTTLPVLQSIGNGF